MELVKEIFLYFPHSITVSLLCIQLLHVSAFSIGRRQAIHYIKHEYIYREMLFASSQLFCGIHTCVLCEILPDDGLQKRPKHVAFIYVIKILLCSIGKEMGMCLEMQPHNGMIFAKIS